MMYRTKWPVGGCHPQVGILLYLLFPGLPKPWWPRCTVCVLQLCAVVIVGEHDGWCGGTSRGASGVVSQHHPVPTVSGSPMDENRGHHGIGPDQRLLEGCAGSHDLTDVMLQI